MGRAVSSCPLGSSCSLVPSRNSTGSDHPSEEAMEQRSVCLRSKQLHPLVARHSWPLPHCCAGPSDLRHPAAAPRVVQEAEPDEAQERPLSQMRPHSAASHRSCRDRFRRCAVPTLPRQHQYRHGHQAHRILTRSRPTPLLPGQRLKSCSSLACRDCILAHAQAASVIGVMLPHDHRPSGKHAFSWHAPLPTSRWV